MSIVGVLGEGAWGTAIATVLAHNKIHVKLWCHDPAVARAIKQTRYNEAYLPGIYLDSYITPVTALQEAVTAVDWIFEAIPVPFLRSVIENAAPYYTKNIPWVLLSKGIEKKTLFLPTQLVQDVLPDSTVAVLYGPSYAKNLSRKEQTGVCVGAPDVVVAERLQRMLTNEYFTTYISHDMIGMQVGAALKNIIALSVGILQGAGYGDNTIALLATAGLQEMSAMAVALGGSADTVYGLSGLGDLILTSFGASSKNQAIGRQIGAGKSIKALEKEWQVLPEGINTLAVLPALMKRYKVKLPLMQGVYELVYKQTGIEQFLNIVMDARLMNVSSK